METKIEKQYNKILDEIKTLDELIQTTEYTHNTTKELKQAIINTIQSLVDQEAEYTYNEIRYNGYFDKIRDAKIKLGLANETERKSWKKEENI